MGQLSVFFCRSSFALSLDLRLKAVRPFCRFPREEPSSSQSPSALVWDHGDPRLADWTLGGLWHWSCAELESNGMVVSDAFPEVSRCYNPWRPHNFRGGEQCALLTPSVGILTDLVGSLCLPPVLEDCRCNPSPPSVRHRLKCSAAVLETKDTEALRSLQPPSLAWMPAAPFALKTLCS